MWPRVFSPWRIIPYTDTMVIAFSVLCICWYLYSVTSSGKVGRYIYFVLACLTVMWCKDDIGRTEMPVNSSGLQAECCLQAFSSIWNCLSEMNKYGVYEVNS